MPTTFFVLAGEASGDLHGAKLLAALKALDPSARFVGMGGPKMAAAGLDVAKDLDGMQVMGFWEVAKRYGFFKKVFHQLLDRVKQERPAALVCIDYPGFNLRFAKEVRKLGIPCLYYIVPQVWAWKPKRAGQMAEFIDRAYCVFEFEPPFFDRFRSPQRKMKTVFVGHPLLDQPPSPKLELPPGPKTVAFLPGSRPSEFRQHFPSMEGAYRIVSGLRKDVRGIASIVNGMSPFPIPASAGHAPQHIPGGGANVHVMGGDVEARAERLLDWGVGRVTVNVPDASHASLLPAAADFSVVKSGTSTLEAGLQGKPLCVVYKGGWISYAIARLVVDIPVFSLVNIVLGRYAVPELLQGEVNPRRIAAEIERGLTDERYIAQQRAALAELPKKLGGPGASQRAAQGMLDFLRGKE